MCGVTLVELVVTLAIGAILLTVGAPSFRSIITSNRLSTASNDVLLGLTTAKSEAIRQNAAIRYCINPSDLSWKVATTSGTDIRIGSLPESIAATTTNLDGTSVTSYECVRFRSDGLSYSTGANLISNGSITLSLQGKNRVIRVRTGAVNVASS